MKIRHCDDDSSRVGLGDPHRGVPANRPDLTLEVSYPGFTRVVADDGEQDLVGNLALLLAQPRRRQLTLDQIALGNRQLLILDVAGHLDDFHPVAHGGGNVVDDIGGADEQHSREVEGNREVVVAERRILLGVEHFQQRRRG